MNVIMSGDGHFRRMLTLKTGKSFHWRRRQVRYKMMAFLCWPQAFSIISAIFIVFLLNANGRVCVNCDVLPTLQYQEHAFKFNETKFH